MGNILTFAYINNKAKYSNKYTDFRKRKKYSKKELNNLPIQQKSISQKEHIS